MKYVSETELKTFKQLKNDSFFYFEKHSVPRLLQYKINDFEYLTFDTENIIHMSEQNSIWEDEIVVVKTIEINEVTK